MRRIEKEQNIDLLGSLKNLKKKKISKEHLKMSIYLQIRGQTNKNLLDKITKFERIKEIQKKALQNKEIENEFQCSICLDFYVEPTTTICGHTFCSQCISKSLISKNKCPLCKTKISNNKMCPSLSINFITKSYVKNQD